MSNILLLEDVSYLAHLYMKVHPSLRIVFDERTVRTFLRDDEKGADVCVFPPLEVVEIAHGEKLHTVCYLMMILLFTEHILLLQGISFAQCLYDIGHHILKQGIQSGIRTVLLHGILYLEDDGTFAVLRPQYRIELLSFLVPDVLKLGKQTVENLFLLCHVSD